MGSRANIFLAAAAVAAVFTAGAIHAHRQATDLASELHSLRARQQQASDLQKEHQRLKEALDHCGDPEQLQRSFRRASGLRTEIEKLRLALRNLAFATAPKDRPVEPVWPKHARVLLAHDWKFSGSDSPDSTLQSVLWAAREGDVEHLAGLIDFRPGDRERADQFLAGLPPETKAQYGNAESLVATLVAANMPTDYAAVAAYNETDGADQALVKLRIEQAGGQQRDLSFMFHHTEDGWRIDVPGKVIAGFEQQLMSK